ncbi:nucleotidyltransferase domain-containing protein [Sporosalibacterium faouarense]|uniref:nucleotidyltransferase domain-containing protein n=1 Tax=Sporosalibacterium faouarense TaxID=516123 RepID=UPI00192A87F4|nr:nucleotidyltransferase domain-containing protein [Sporosalibacterium faouarense]
MITHQELVNRITQELYKDKNVSALILYGSVSRREESANSDIDLLAITNKNHLEKRHEVRYGITVEFVEMNLKILKKFIAENEIPILFALADGIVLFDKIPEIKQLVEEAKKTLDKGPTENEKWKNEGYRIKKRSDLTEIYKDLLDIDDVIKFNYVASLLITNAITILLENNNLWHQTRKKTINYLKSQCYESYEYIETLLNPVYSIYEKRDAAKNLTEYVLKPHGGILSGDAIIFSKTN